MDSTSTSDGATLIPTVPPLAANAATTVFSVEQLNRRIKQLIEGELPLVWVQAEISNFKAHTSGHFYLSLKDAKSQIRAVMFRGHNARLKFRPSDGLEVIVRGRLSVYEPRGEYQIMIESMEPVGAGALQKAFEQLKTKLKAEGLFESGRKRPLPAFPRHVAIVTSPTGAAIRDMVNVLSRRNRTVEITLVPTIVQGEAAAPLIVQALKTAWKLPRIDVVIIGRGGGSMEDLWAFNDEALARTIAQSPVPVISAVGHEVDFTIADFVADLRAPTPSAAAELVVKSSDDVAQKLSLLWRLLQGGMQKQFRVASHRLRASAGRLLDPRRHLQDLILRNDDLATRLQRSAWRGLENRRLRVQSLRRGLRSPADILAQQRAQLEGTKNRLGSWMQRALDRRQARLQRVMGLLDGLSPLQVVERGYSITTLPTGQLVKKASQVRPGDKIEIHLMQGQIHAEVLSATEGKSHGF